MDDHRKAFREEVYELLIELETSLLELEETPEDTELIGRVFRAMHTIKGSGAMFGFDDIAAFTHDIETAFDNVRNGAITVTKQLIDLTLEARDQIRNMIDGEETDNKEADRILTLFRTFIENSEENEGEKNDEKIEKTEAYSSSGESKIYRIRFRPDNELFSTGTNPGLLFDELRELGTCKVIARTENIPALNVMDPEKCYIGWDVVIETSEGIDAVQDVFIFVADEENLIIEEIDNESEDAEYKKIGEILIEKNELAPENLKSILNEKKKTGEMLIESGASQKNAVVSALAEQEQVRSLRKKRIDSSASTSIRVSAEKLDILVDLVGELVTVQASLSQKAQIDEDVNLTSIAEQVERLTSELRDNTMSIRMLPIGTTFSKFKRLVRDLSSELGKDVAMKTEGGETELDKTVIEHLSDPLVHIIRNSIDHGIESPDIRKENAKPVQGTITLSAKHRGAFVLIEVRDDGNGLDPEKIRAKAIEKGLISEEAELSENELFSQLFVPGFSTAAEVTDVSGRGVGMDVVKQSIENLRGSIELTSKKGKGTTVILKLPLTLAIIDGLLVEIANEHYVMPLAAVEECVELNRAEALKTNSRKIANVRGEMVPYILLRDFFGMKDEKPEIEQIAIAEVDGERIGFVVDRVIGEHQTVIKSLGRVYRNANEFSGATIMADGTIALIIDVNRVVKTAENETNRVCVQ